jgi:hypothetical protein
MTAVIKFNYTFDNLFWHSLINIQILEIYRGFFNVCMWNEINHIFPRVGAGRRHTQVIKFHIFHRWPMTAGATTTISGDDSCLQTLKTIDQFQEKLMMRNMNIWIFYPPLSNYISCNTADHSYNGYGNWPDVSGKTTLSIGGATFSEARISLLSGLSLRCNEWNSCNR